MEEKELNAGMQVVVVAGGTLTANLGTVSGLATETTLSAINGKITKCDTDNVNLNTDVVSAWGGHGSKSVGTSAVQLIVTSTPAVKGVLVKAAITNTGKIYVGKDSSVTANTSSTNDGIELSAGEPFSIPINNANKIYLIATAASQTVFWAAL